MASEGFDMLDPDERFRHRDRVLAQRAAETLVLLDLDGGQYYALDEVSSRIWELCDGSLSVAKVVEAICADFDAPPEEITSDVLDFLEELIDERLVVPAA